MNTEKPQGQGSIWNINSWHWETKNYTEIAKALIGRKLESLNFKKDDLTIKVSNVKKITGDAQVNIRKGKQIICFEFEAEVEWFAENSVDEVSGTFKIIDLNDADMDFEISGLSANDKKEISESAKSLLKKELRPAIESTFKTLRDDLAQIESDPAKMQENEAKRKEAQELIAKAKLEKGAEKEQLLLDQKKKDLEFKSQNIGTSK